jgi:hypothetical protein
MSLQCRSPFNILHLVAKLEESEAWRVCFAFLSKANAEIAGKFYVKIIKGVKLNAREEMETVQILSE